MRNEIKVTKDAFESIVQRNTKLVVTAIVNGKEEYYDSRVEDITTKHISIALPTKKGQPLSVSKDSAIKISAIVTSGRITFDTFVIAIAMKPLPVLSIAFPDKIRQEQLRQFFRVSVRFKVPLFRADIATLNNQRKALDIPEHDVVVNDISGGGCRITTDLSFTAGEIVTVDFSESPVDGIELVECKVVWTESNSYAKRNISLRFRDLEEANRDRIVRYVFRQQMELRKILK